MEIQLLLAVVFSIALLLILILWLKIQPFLALLTSSVAAGLIAGMPPMTVIESRDVQYLGFCGYCGRPWGTFWGDTGAFRGRAVAGYLLTKEVRR